MLQFYSYFLFIFRMEHISSVQIEVFTDNLVMSLPAVSAISKQSVENITKEGLTSLAAYILYDVNILAASLHGEVHHSRIAVADFIGAHLGKRNKLFFLDCRILL